MDVVVGAVFEVRLVSGADGGEKGSDEDGGAFSTGRGGVGDDVDGEVGRVPRVSVLDFGLGRGGGC